MSLNYPDGFNGLDDFFDLDNDGELNLTEEVFKFDTLIGFDTEENEEDDDDDDEDDEDEDDDDDNDDNDDNDDDYSSIGNFAIPVVAAGMASGNVVNNSNTNNKSNNNDSVIHAYDTNEDKAKKYKEDQERIAREKANKKTQVGCVFALIGAVALIVLLFNISPIIIGIGNMYDEHKDKKIAQSDENYYQSAVINLEENNINEAWNDIRKIEKTYDVFENHENYQKIYNYLHGYVLHKKGRLTSAHHEVRFLDPYNFTGQSEESIQRIKSNILKIQKDYVEKRHKMSLEIEKNDPSTLESKKPSIGLSEKFINKTDYGKYAKKRVLNIVYMRDDYKITKYYFYDTPKSSNYFIDIVTVYNGYVVDVDFEYNENYVQPTTSYTPSYRKYYGTYSNKYDDGYNDIYENDDYDSSRYNSDKDYARGVDDAMDDAEEDYGDDW